MNTVTKSTATAERTVRELALEIPGATRIFEQLGIDYCCGGLKPLAAACLEAGASVEQVLALLARAQQETMPEPPADWQEARLSELIDHVVSTHHQYLRRELPRLEKLAEKVVSVHGGNYPELAELQSTLAELSAELLSHLMKEEQILFPYIAQAEGGAAPPCCFGSVENPIRMMMSEHDRAGEALRRMRTLSRDYAVPADACISYRTLYEALVTLEADLHQHIHLENNILFPRAVAMGEAA